MKLTDEMNTGEQPTTQPQRDTTPSAASIKHTYPNEALDMETNTKSANTEAHPKTQHEVIDLTTTTQTRQPSMAANTKGATNLFATYERLVSIVVFGLLSAIFFMFIFIFWLKAGSSSLLSQAAIEHTIFWLPVAHVIAYSLLVTIVLTLLITVGDICIRHQKQKDIATLFTVCASGVSTGYIVLGFPALWQILQALNDPLSPESFATLGIDAIIFGPSKLTTIMPAIILSWLLLTLSLMLATWRIFGERSFQRGNAHIRQRAKTQRVLTRLVSSIVIVFFALFNYFAFLHEAQLDVFDMAHVHFTGVSGSGEVTVSKDSSKLDLDKELFTSLFLLDLKYDISPKTNLANGDIVTLRATVDEELYNRLKTQINIGPMQTEIRVTGLGLVPQSAVDVPNLNELSAQLDASMRETFTSNINLIYTLDVTDTYYGAIPINAEQIPDSSHSLKYGTLYKIYHIRVESELRAPFEELFGKDFYHINGVTNILLHEDGSLVQNAPHFTDYIISFGSNERFESREAAEAAIKDKLPQAERIELDI
jgi:hypothetical protein